MRDLSATGGSGIRQNLGTDVRLGKKTFFGMATTKEVEVRDQDSPFQTLTPGGRGTPLDKPYRYVPPQRVGFFEPFWSENRYRLCPFWSGIGYDFRENFLNYGNV